jgi:hypothetical protein
MENTGDDVTRYVDCSGGWSNCYLCEECHRGQSDKTFTLKEHDTIYFTRFQIRLAGGTKVPFGTRGEYLALDGGSLVKHSAKGEKIFTFPPSAVLLRNSAGQPRLVMSSAKPTIHAIK